MKKNECRFIVTSAQIMLSNELNELTIQEIIEKISNIPGIAKIERESDNMIRLQMELENVKQIESLIATHEIAKQIVAEQETIPYPTTGSKLYTAVVGQ